MRRTRLLRRTRLRSVSRKTRTHRWPVLRALRAQVLVRARGQCEYRPRTSDVVIHWGPLDVHHVVPRSAKRDDSPSNAACLCRVHHRMTEAPYLCGRLVIEPLGKGRFRFTRVWAADKWAARREREEARGDAVSGGSAGRPRPDGPLGEEAGP